MSIVRHESGMIAVECSHHYCHHHHHYHGGTIIIIAIISISIHYHHICHQHQASAACYSTAIAVLPDAGRFPVIHIWYDQVSGPQPGHSPVLIGLRPCWSAISTATAIIATCACRLPRNERHSSAQKRFGSHFVLMQVLYVCKRWPTLAAMFESSSLRLLQLQAAETFTGARSWFGLLYPTIS